MQTYELYCDDDEVIAKLNQLGLELQPLREAVNQAHLQRDRLTSNHPNLFHGLEMWGWLVAALRNQLRPYGWSSLEKSNYSLTTNVERSLAIGVASGDANVGIPQSMPSTRSSKGKSTVAAIEQNCQLDLFAEVIPMDDETAVETWILLHYTDHNKNEIRFELSRPSGVGKDGKINIWSERILLGEIALDNDTIDINVPSGPDIDFEINRKTS